jgi:hypothetical protein
MKLNHELERKMMFAIESYDQYNPSNEVLKELRAEGFQDNEIAYTALKLHEGGLIELAPSIDPQGYINSFATGNLTYKGHTILDNIRDDSVWAKAKEKIGTTFSSVSLSIIAGVAEGYIKGKLGI